MKILQLQLQTAHGEELSWFYRDVLELKISRTQSGFSLQAGYSTLTFTDASPGSNPLYHFAFNIPFDSVDSACEWLKNRVELLWIEDYQSNIAEFTSWKARSLYFFDRAGNIVELIGRESLPFRSGGKFHADQLLSVSEIGLVWPADNFQLAVTDFMNQFALPYFSRQAPLPSFRAIGDDEGLLIAVPEGRNWFPTKNTGAERAPLDIKFSHKGKIQHFAG